VRKKNPARQYLELFWVAGHDSADVLGDRVLTLGEFSTMLVAANDIFEADELARKEIMAYVAPTDDYAGSYVDLQGVRVVPLCANYPHALVIDDMDGDPATAERFQENDYARSCAWPTDNLYDIYISIDANSTTYPYRTVCVSVAEDLTAAKGQMGDLLKDYEKPETMQWYKLNPSGTPFAYLTNTNEKDLPLGDGILSVTSSASKKGTKRSLGAATSRKYMTTEEVDQAKRQAKGAPSKLVTVT